jgi:hypothetical protein
VGKIFGAVTESGHNSIRSVISRIPTPPAAPYISLPRA